MFAQAIGYATHNGRERPVDKHGQPGLVVARALSGGSGETIGKEVHTLFKLTAFLASLRRDEDGQGLAEYALILALIAIIAIVALIFLGGQVSQILSNVGNSI